MPLGQAGGGCRQRLLLGLCGSSGLVAFCSGPPPGVCPNSPATLARELPSQFFGSTGLEQWTQGLTARRTQPPWSRLAVAHWRAPVLQGLYCALPGVWLEGLNLKGSTSKQTVSSAAGVSPAALPAAPGPCARALHTRTLRPTAHAVASASPGLCAPGGRALAQRWGF